MKNSNDCGQHLNVEDGTMITMGEPKKLPTNSPLKVYLAFGLDMAVKGNFDKWLAADFP